MFLYFKIQLNTTSLKINASASEVKISTTSSASFGVH